MNYSEALDWLYSTQLFGIKLGLENAHRLAAALDAYPAGAKIIHVAGTNGKGSVCALAESIARQAGLKTGLFTSPHLVRYNERIKIAGVEVGDLEIAQSLTNIRALVEEWQPHPTFFEITTALALQLFKQNGCEIILLETGLGGRLDATNLVSPSVSVLTRIDFDHAQWLGDTLEKIAFEKAGIIKPRTPVLASPQTPEVLTVFEKQARLKNAPFTVVDQPFQAAPIALAGRHQTWNAALAIQALLTCGIPLTENQISTGLRDVFWPGRFQQIRPGIYLDGAHNPAAAAALVQTWIDQFPRQKPTILIGMLADKEVLPTLSALAPLAKAWIAVTPQSPRSLPADDLATRLREVSSQPITVADSLSTALLETAPPILVCGSLFLVGEILACYQKEQLRPTSQ